MIGYDDVSPSLRRFLGTWEVFRRFGFSADNLYILISQSAKLRGALGCFCMLKYRGREFTVECGPIDGEEEIAEEYKRVTSAITEHKVDPAALERMLHESEAWNAKVDLLFALQAKGIYPPNPQAN